METKPKFFFQLGKKDCGSKPFLHFSYFFKWFFGHAVPSAVLYLLLAKMSSRTAKFAPTTASSAPLIGAAPSEARNDAAYSIALFRILFGSILLRFFWDLFNSSWISDQFENAQYLPAYNWTEGIIFTAFSIRFSLVVLLVASVCFVIGLFYRLNCFILLVFYSYIYLANPTWYVKSEFL